MDSLPVILLVVRYVVTAVGAILVGRGVTNSAEVEIVSGAILAVVPAIFGYISHRQQKAAIVNAAATGVPVQATALSSTKPTAEAVATLVADGTIPPQPKENP